ncbi:MAG: hypothetical protein M3Y49_15835 [Actinomycetota bacterium]|nr:hypothetical protein [Actinomycetota bacterium]
MKPEGEKTMSMSTTASPPEPHLDPSTTGEGEGKDLRICIVSGGDEIRSRAYVNHTVYAREYGLDYRLECALDEGVTDVFFFKTAIVRRVLPLYDWIVWLDDDAWITDFDRDGFRELAQRAEAQGKFMVGCENPLEPNGFWSKFNAGVAMFKNCERTWQFLGLMTEDNIAVAAEWWDPELHGWSSGGDQDISVWALDQAGLTDGVLWVDHRELNSRWQYYSEGLDDAFVLHFCGHWDKDLSRVIIAKRFNVGQELVPAHLLDKYSSRVRNPMSDLEFGRRYALWKGAGFIKSRTNAATQARLKKIINR